MQEMQETQVQSLGREDPLEKSMATHSSILYGGESHRQRSLVGYHQGGRESDTTERLSMHTLIWKGLFHHHPLYIYIFKYI